MDLETFIKTTKRPEQALMARYGEVAALVQTSAKHLHNIARYHKRPGMNLALRILHACHGVEFEQLVQSKNNQVELTT